MKLLKGDSFPIFLVSDGVSQQSCRGHLSKEVARSSGCRRSVQRFRCSMAVFELLARATGAWVVAAGNGHLVNRSSRIADGVPRRSAAGKPVRMDFAGGGRYRVNQYLMSRAAVVVSLSYFLQPVPAAFGAVEVDDLEPVGMRFNKWLPTRRVECNALDVAAAPFVDNRHSASFVVAF